MKTTVQKKNTYNALHALNYSFLFQVRASSKKFAGNADPTSKKKREVEISLAINLSVVVGENHLHFETLIV